ncbi:MAG: hypothetical protein HYV08_13965 [Deltaproteobacteria bacterium]|nr:hypothetical protein [Deltaproteobacteria bacterium]MBI3077492.1 hypothetical protein [Deltaproteobacteria bacterium]
MTCSYCGRGVHPTRHSRQGYQVDYYLWHTGRIQPASVQGGSDEAPSKQFFLLVEPVDIITCVDCLARPEVLEDVERKYRGG